MWSMKTIQDLADEASKRAKKQHLKPRKIADALKSWKVSGRLNVPFLGDYVPEGWVRVEEIEPYFVSASGVGDETEPALNKDRFMLVLEDYARSGEPYGLGVIEQGQFQVYIALYRPDPRDWTHTGELTEDELRIGGGKR